MASLPFSGWRSIFLVKLSVGCYRAKSDFLSLKVIVKRTNVDFIKIIGIAVSVVRELQAEALSRSIHGSIHRQELVFLEDPTPDSQQSDLQN